MSEFDPAQPALLHDARTGRMVTWDWARAMSRPKVSPLRYPVTPLQASDEHHCRCPICGHQVDELDLEEVLQHVEPDHNAPAKN